MVFVLGRLVGCFSCALSVDDCRLGSLLWQLQLQRWLPGPGCCSTLLMLFLEPTMGVFGHPRCWGGGQPFCGLPREDPFVMCLFFSFASAAIIV